MYYTGAIKTYIDNYTNRTFTEVASADYWYDGNCEKELELEDFQSITALNEYDSLGGLVYTFETTDWELYPLNDLPKNRIRLIEGLFSGYRYKITGVKGFSATCPDDIEYAAQLITENLSAQQGGLQSESIEGYSYTVGNVVESNPVVRGILESYRKILI